MRTLYKSILFVCLLCTVFSCTTVFPEPITNASSDNNPTYSVSYLFEYEGVKVYRFYDHGNWVYFTKPAGDVTAIANDSTNRRVQTITKNYFNY